jgi:WhiB family transcriptional regulator, redox-sensing transcriptional regulator
MVLTQVPAQRGEQQARRDWWASAACREADPELFFPVASAGPAAGEIARAKAVCAVCRVRRQCLQYALATHQMHGVWGGTTEDERQVQVRGDREHGRRERRPREHADPAGPGRVRRGTGEPRPLIVTRDLPLAFPGKSPAAARRTRPPGERPRR